MEPITKHDLKALCAAIEIAKTGKCRQRHGAVIYKRNKMFSCGFNKYKTHPKADEYYCYPFLHAEMSTVLKAGDNAGGNNIAVVRVNRKGNLMYSRPCEGCYKVMKDAGLKYVIFSTGEGEAIIKEALI